MNVPDSYWPEWRPFSISDEISKKNVSFKTKDIAWIVSHCHTDSNRESFVEEFQNLTSLKIDIFGQCGKQGLDLPARTLEKEYGEFDFVQAQLLD